MASGALDLCSSSSQDDSAGAMHGAEQEQADMDAASTEQLDDDIDYESNDDAAAHGTHDAGSSDEHFVAEGDVIDLFNDDDDEDAWHIAATQEQYQLAASQQPQKQQPAAASMAPLQPGDERLDVADILLKYLFQLPSFRGQQKVGINTLAAMTCAPAQAPVHAHHDAQCIVERQTQLSWHANAACKDASTILSCRT